MTSTSAAAGSDRLARHWRKTRVITAVLLVFWGLGSFGVIVFARELAAMHFLGWPLSFYMGAQGSLIIFLLIIGCYCLVMKRLDRELPGAPARPAPTDREEHA